MFDVTVIGAGVVGGLVARELSRYKLSICILEAESDVAMGATKANSAIVHAGFDAKEGTLKAKFNVLGNKMMESVCRELSVKYKRNGSLVIGFTEEDKKTLSELYLRGQKNGVPDLALLSGEEARKIEPNLSEDVTSALLAPTGAIVCPYELAIAAVGNAMDNGAVLKTDFKVERIEKGDGYFSVHSEKGTVETKYIVNAAGIYSDEIAALVGDVSFKVHPRRGEYILLDKECGSLVTHTVFRTPSKMGKGILVTPTVDGNLLLGPTSVDIEDKSDRSSDEAGFARIIREASENIKNIPFNKTITSFAGLRAVGDTGDFIIKFSDDGFLTLGGIESPGLTASVAIAEHVVDLLSQNGLSMEKNEAFDPIRKSMHAFREASIEEKNRMIKEDPAYGKIICRCEGVTEGEILSAIRTNPKPVDLDGIKRRTRAQMGRCQGGFCTPYIIEILAKELGVEETEIKKSSSGSNLIHSRTKGDF